MKESPSDLDRAVKFSFEELRRNGRYIDRLSIELQTVVRVVSARGVIGNGGMRYFFERDWEGTPPYAVFVNAFRTIGADEIADSIEGIVALLGPNPHLDSTARLSRLGELWDMDPCPLGEFWFDPMSIYEICRKIDNFLEQYVAQHRAVFFK